MSNDLPSATRRYELLTRGLLAPAMAKSPLTTHVLDTSTGAPAAGLRLELWSIELGSETPLFAGRCGSDGRVSGLISNGEWARGVYRLRFFSGEYFEEKGVESFYPHCDVTFQVSDTESHYHVPLILSPFGFSTYRGS